MASSGGEADAGADLRALFMADLTPGALNASGVASASASSSSSNHLGWGGVAIDSSAASIPWFGRRRGPARQPRGRAAGGLGGDGSTSSGSGSRPPTAGAAAPGGVGDWPGGGGGGGAAPGQQPGSQHAHHQQPQRQQQDPGMSVQEIVGLLKRTPRAEPVPPRIHAALHALDSRAVALLLKDVSKAGLDGRSIELFDWLRALPERHLLAPLCDVYTYTAAISLCIYQQNADRAMAARDVLARRGAQRAHVHRAHERVHQVRPPERRARHLQRDEGRGLHTKRARVRRVDAT
jgi:pentatricopeptide repeat domain-containing protein 1